MDLEDELLESFARESVERTMEIVEGLGAPGGPDADSLEGLRREAHTLKGTAGVLGQQRLDELAALIEQRLLAAGRAGRIKPEVADLIAGAARAFREGAEAAASGAAEPPAIAAAIDSLSA